MYRVIINGFQHIVSSRLDNEEAVTIQLPKSGKESFRVYRYLESNPPINQFGDLQALSETVKLNGSSLKLSMPAKSVITITNDYEEKSNSVCAEITACDGSILKWKPVSDKITAITVFLPLRATLRNKLHLRLPAIAKFKIRVLTTIYTP